MTAVSDREREKDQNGQCRAAETTEGSLGFVPDAVGSPWRLSNLYKRFPVAGLKQTQVLLGRGRQCQAWADSCPQEQEEECPWEGFLLGHLPQQDVLHC